MRRAYLYDQDARDAVHMDVGDQVFIDTPKTKREALNDLLYRQGLRAGDTLVVTAKSKLGSGQGAVRHEKRLTEIGAGLEISPSPLMPRRKKKPGAKRGPTGQELVYLKGIWASGLDPQDAITQATRHMGFDVDRQWMNYHVSMRDGGPSIKERNAKKETSGE